MKHSIFDQAATLAAANGHVSITMIQSALSCAVHDAAQVCDELHAAGIVGDYDSTDCRPFVGTSTQWPAVHQRRAAWIKAREKCLDLLKMEKDEARGWWMALDVDRRAAVMRAAVVPFRHVHAAWDDLPISARAALREQHDKRRRNWVLLNAEFSGRVSA